jgi:hypothetical protein
LRSVGTELIRAPTELLTAASVYSLKLSPHCQNIASNKCIEWRTQPMCPPFLLAIDKTKICIHTPYTKLRSATQYGRECTGCICPVLSPPKTDKNTNGLTRTESNIDCDKTNEIRNIKPMDIYRQ